MKTNTLKVAGGLVALMTAGLAGAVISGYIAKPPPPKDYIWRTLQMNELQPPQSATYDPRTNRVTVSGPIPAGYRLYLITFNSTDEHIGQYEDTQTFSLSPQADSNKPLRVAFVRHTDRENIQSHFTTVYRKRD